MDRTIIGGKFWQTGNIETLRYLGNQSQLA